MLGQIAHKHVKNVTIQEKVHWKSPRYHQIHYSYGYYSDSILLFNRRVRLYTEPS